MSSSPPHLILRIFIPIFLIIFSAPLHSASGDISTAYESNTLLPRSIAFDSSRNMYIADYSSRRVIKVTPSGIESFFAGSGAVDQSPLGDFGPAAAAYLHHGPRGIHVDLNDNVYISTYSRIRKVDTSGIITTVAGNGIDGFSGDGGDAKLASINNPGGIVSDSAGNIYFADTDNNRIRKILSNGNIVTVAGGGSADVNVDELPATSVGLHRPTNIDIDSVGNLFITESTAVIKISKLGLISSHYSSSYGFKVSGLVLDDANNIYVRVHSLGDYSSCLYGCSTSIQRINPQLESGPVYLAFDMVPPSNAEGLAINAIGDLYFTDSENRRVRKIEGAATVYSNTYRLYNPYSGEHLYTTFKDEYDFLGALGWIQENIAFRGLPNASQVNGIAPKPWLRLFNPNSGLHHWTLNQSEYDTLGALGWNQEVATGYIFDSSMAGVAPLFRLYNPYDGNHHWTMDTVERDALVGTGWRNEGTAGYVYPPATYLVGP